MLEMKTKNKVRFIMPEIVVIRNRMWSPKVELTPYGNQVILEPIISTDEENKDGNNTSDS